MYEWIYDHFINTVWFILFMLSLPSLGALYMFYKWYKLDRKEGGERNYPESGLHWGDDSQGN